LDAAELKLDLDPAPTPVPILLVDVAPFGDAFLYGDLVLLDTPGP